MVSRTAPRQSLMNPANRVPYYQRLFQKNDGVRQWLKTSRGPLYVYPFYATTLTVGVLTFYGMLRMAAGKKTFFGAN